MKVIFLDVDGVLNGMDFLTHAEKLIEENLGYIDDRSVSRVVKIIQETGAKVVLSSSWRSMFNDKMEPQYRPAEDLAARFARYGISFIGKTPSRSSYRGREVRAWLENHPEVTTYVILDDSAFPDWNELTTSWIQTDWQTGIDDTDVERAIAILNADKDQK